MTAVLPLEGNRALLRQGIAPLEGSPALDADFGMAPSTIACQRAALR